MALITENIIYSCDDVGISSGSYHSIKYGSAVAPNSITMSNTPVINYQTNNIIVQTNNIITLSGGLVVTPEYWVDPTLGSGAYTDELIKLSQGIPIVFSIYNCSGIYSTNPFEFWSGSEVEGVKVDNILTPNMRFTIAGDSKAYRDAAAWGGGYWATGENINITLTHSGINILHATSQTIKSVIWHYNLTGFFNLYLNLRLDLTNARTQYPFTHPDFYMSGCILSFDMLDKNGVSVLKKSYSGIVIDPPNTVGSIVTSTNKTISDVTFNMSRDAIRGSTTYTELHNVIKNNFNMNSKRLESSTPWNYKNDGISNDSFLISNDSMMRGGYCYMQYEPKLAGIKPGVLGEIAYTNYVTNCKGHKFNIDNVVLKISTSGIFGVDVLNEITNQNPYIFIDPVNATGHIEITFDANHEDWSDGTIRDNLSATGIYPYLSKVYAFAVSSNDIINVESTIFRQKISYTPYDSATTYPNVDITETLLDQILTAFPNKTITTLAGTAVTLTSQSIIVNLLKSGRYKIYLGLKDQFNQISLWCITNKVNNYNIPF